MSSAFYIFTSVVNLFISAMLLLMLIRAILSWLPINDEHPIVEFLYAVTEFVVAPVHALLYHFEWIRNFPMDISFLVAYLILTIIQVVLRNVI